MTTQHDTEYQARARATLGAELGALADQLTSDQLEALATEVVAEVLANDRGFGEYVTTHVANITSSSTSDADRLRKVRSYADLISGSQAVTRERWNGGASMECPECGVFTREGDDCPSGHYARATETAEVEGGPQAVTPEADLEVCVDCAHLLANGEAPEDNPEFSLLESWDGYVVALNCDDDCQGFFSWSRCDGCGSTLGGDRHPVAIIEEPPTKLEEFTEEFPGVPEAVLETLIEGHNDYSPEDFTFEGEATSYAKLAERMVDDGLYGEIPEHLTNYIDYEAIGRDLDCSGIYEIRHSFTGYYWTIN